MYLKFGGKHRFVIYLSQKMSSLVCKGLKVSTIFFTSMRNFIETYQGSTCVHVRSEI